MSIECPRAVLARCALTLILGLGAVACAPRLEPPGVPFEEAARRLDREPSLLSVEPHDPIVADRIRSILAEPLTPDGATEIALINNHAFRAELQQLGFAWADVIGTTRLENPTLEFAARFPSRSGSPVEFDLGLSQNVVNLLLRPARRDIAEGQYDARRLELSADIIALHHDTTKAAIELQAAFALRALGEEGLKAAEAAYEFGRELRRAGNQSELLFLDEQAEYENARLILAEGDLSIVERTERLTGLMGLWGTEWQWQMAPDLDALPAEEPPFDALEAMAVETGSISPPCGGTWRRGARRSDWSRSGVGPE